MKHTRLFVLSFLLVFMSGCFMPSPLQTRDSVPVKNIIFFIGDGMGPSHVTLTRYYSLFVLEQELYMTRVMNTGSTAYMTSYSADSIVTDSGAAGTAMATGYKTNNGMISMTPDGVPCTTILERAKKAGKRVGVVTTTRLTHATPAVFMAHHKDRNAELEIADQVITSGTDVMLAGGLRYFLPQTVQGSKRRDDYDLLAQAESLGYTVLQDAAALRALRPADTTKVLGLFHLSHMSYEIDRDNEKEPSIAEMTQMAINILSRNKKGFFLMVEGGLIDYAGHENDAVSLVRDTLAFDKAIGVALDYMTTDPNTLIMVTADHDTGGPAMSQGRPTPDNRLKYFSVEDLRLLGKATGSFASFFEKTQKAEDAAAVQAIVKKNTGIDITLIEAQEIRDRTPLTPTLSVEKYMITDEVLNALKQDHVPAETLTKLEGVKDKAYVNDEPSFQRDVVGVLEEEEFSTYKSVIWKRSRSLVKPKGVSIARAVADEWKISWPSRHHTATALMLFAVGPYCERFTGFLDNADVYKIMVEAFHIGH